MAVILRPKSMARIGCMWGCQCCADYNRGDKRRMRRHVRRVERREWKREVSA